MPMRFAGRVAIVTSGGAGISRATCLGSLASDEASFVHGAIVNVNGGLL
jgi:hypothetical protein